MGIDVQEAIRRSMQTEKDAMDFYRLGAERMQDSAARRTFELLAREEREHAGQFFQLYRPNEVFTLEAFLAAAPDSDSRLMTLLSGISVDDFNEQKALELALEEERMLEESLWATANLIDDPDVRGVFELNARETRNHYLLIEAEYARLMGMVDESEMDIYVRE